MFDFEKSEVYRKAKQFNLSIGTLLSEVPADEQSKQTIRQHATDVLVNISKALGWYTKEERKFKHMEARSSVFASMALLDSLKDDGTLTEEKYQEIGVIGDEISRILYSMMKKTELINPQ